MTTNKTYELKMTEIINIKDKNYIRHSNEYKIITKFISLLIQEKEKKYRS